MAPIVAADERLRAGRRRCLCRGIVANDFAGNVPRLRRSLPPLRRCRCAGRASACYSQVLQSAGPRKKRRLVLVALCKASRGGGIRVWCGAYARLQRCQRPGMRAQLARVHDAVRIERRLRERRQLSRLLGRGKATGGRSAARGEGARPTRLCPDPLSACRRPPNPSGVRVLPSAGPGAHDRAPTSLSQENPTEEPSRPSAGGAALQRELLQASSARKARHAP